MTIRPLDFRRKSLHVHRLLDNVPLKDVWAIPLETSSQERHVADLIKLTEQSTWQDLPRMARFLFWLRDKIGNWFRWDNHQLPATPPPSSYAHRLPLELATHSLDRVGTPYRPVQLLYHLEDEILLEVINATIHALICLSLEQTPVGYQAYLAVYTIHTRRWCCFYLLAVQPFRHWIVYPALIRTIQRRWTEEYIT